MMNKAKMLLFVTLALIPTAALGYNAADEAPYLTNFNAHIAASYAAADDTSLSSILDPCKNGPDVEVGGEVVVVSAGGKSITAGEVQLQCDASQVCVIPQGVTLEMTESLNVGALSINGNLLWTDETQTQEEVSLCAGYVVTEHGGDYYMRVTQKKAWIYIKNNGAAHHHLATRVFGGMESRVEIIGRRLERTWSLLDQPLSIDDTSLTLLHHPSLMGWQVGDRIGVAPTELLSTGTGQSFTITDISANGTIVLDAPSTYNHKAQFYPPKAKGQGPILMSAEVVNLSRNIIITGKLMDLSTLQFTDSESP